MLSRIFLKACTSISACSQLFPTVDLTYVFMHLRIEKLPPFLHLCILLRTAYAVLWAANLFIGLETPEHNAFDQFWKFIFHNTWFLGFFKNHQQTFSWPDEHPSPHLKVIKMWFGPSIKYLYEPFFVDFRCRNGISFWVLKLQSHEWFLKQPYLFLIKCP